MDGNVKVTVTRSAGPDGAVLVMIDTDFEPDASDDSPGLRVRVNDGTVYEGKAYESVPGEWLNAPPERTLSVDLSDLVETTATGTCRHCQRNIEKQDGLWVDPEATGDDSVWRETCDAHDTFVAEHEPVEASVAEPVQTAEITIRLEVTDTRQAQAWLERTILSEGKANHVHAIVDWD